MYDLFYLVISYKQKLGYLYILVVERLTEGITSLPMLNILRILDSK